MSLVAMEEVIKATEDSEPLQHGARHRMVRRFYMALAMVFLVYGGPEFGPFSSTKLGPPVPQGSVRRRHSHSW